MNHSQFLNDLSSKLGFSKVETKKYMKIYNDTIFSILKNNDRLDIGIGILTIKKRKARKGRNPRTGEEIMIKASNNLKFKASKKIRDLINN